MQQIKLSMIAAFAFVLVGCGSPVAVSATKDKQVQTVRRVVGTSLVGAHGRTKADQDAIDTTATRLCAVRAWTAAECAKHDGAE